MNDAAEKRTVYYWHADGTPALTLIERDGRRWLADDNTTAELQPDESADDAAVEWLEAVQ